MSRSRDAESCRTPQRAGLGVRRRGRAARWLALAVALGWAIAPSTGRAEATSAGASENAAPASQDESFTDRLGWAFATGFGYGFQMRERTENSDVTDVRMLLFMPQVSWEIFDQSDRGQWYSGALDLLVEPQLAINFEPAGTGVGGGITGGFRYALRPDRTWSPYIVGVAGFGGIDYDLVDQDDGFAFFLQIGLGLKRRLGPVALTGDLRLYHISNAGTHAPNAGIDMIAFMLGVETP